MGVVDSNFVMTTKAQAKERVDKEMEERMNIPPTDPLSIFDDVYEKPTWIQEEERRDLNVSD